MTISSACHFIKLPFHQIAILSTCYLIKSLFHQLTITSTCYFINQCNFVFCEGQETSLKKKGERAGVNSSNPGKIVDEMASWLNVVAPKINR
jgi:hypothetical protein